MRLVRIPYFRIWYSSIFVILFLLTVLLTLVSPADIAYQSIRKKTQTNLFSIGGAYVLTVAIWAFIWSSRVYTNRAVLRDIPKAYVPIDDGELPRKVLKLVRRQAERSALLAWDTRPRDLRKELEDEAGVARCDTEHAPGRFRRKSRLKPTTVVYPEAAAAVWGKIAHTGWSSPCSPDLPSLQYEQVVQELPNLIEAKAVSLAPPDPAFEQPEGFPVAQDVAAIPDASIVALLQRPPTMGLRDYLGRLDALNLIEPPELAPTFLAQYERARFSARPLTEPEFRELMATFAAVLSGMASLDPVALSHALQDADSDADTSSALSSLARAPSLRSASSSGSAASALHPETVCPNNDGDTSSASASVRRLRPNRTSSTGTVLTAPSRARNSPSPSPASFTRTRTNLSATSSSSASLRSANSVIRLTPEPRAAGTLPYQLHYRAEDGD